MRANSSCAHSCGRRLSMATLLRRRQAQTRAAPAMSASRVPAAIHGSRVGMGSSACGLMSRRVVSPSTSTELMAISTGAANVSMSCPLPSVTLMGSGGVWKLPGAKRRASIGMRVVSVPSPLSTTSAESCPTTVRSPHSAGSSGVSTV